MSALVKNGLRKFLIGGGTGASMHTSGFRTTIQAGQIMTTDKDGTWITEPNEKTVRKGQRVIILPPEGALVPSKYEILVSWNPKLLLYGDVSSPTLVAPKAGNIMLAFTAKAQVDLLADLTHIWEVYLVD